MREDEAKEVASEGRAAYREGKSVSANPHPPGTKDYWAWLRGWNSAEAIDQLT